MARQPASARSRQTRLKTASDEGALSQYVPPELRTLAHVQTDLPRIARDSTLMQSIEVALAQVPTRHTLWCGDARTAGRLEPGSVHLVVTSPPYWTLKTYRPHENQLGHVGAYDQFLDELDKVWRRSYDLLVPGGRLVCVVGDVCLSRRKNDGRHTVVPLHASIQERCRALGFDNLAPIIWHKIANAVYEVQNGNGGSFLGKPYEPNAVIKNDVEFILMQRKPGGYRQPDVSARVLSLISQENHHRWFRQIWSDVTGASTRTHPAPYPIELAERLIRMFSFVGDTVLDPFLGTGTTSVAAARSGRNSVGLEVDPHYFRQAVRRLHDATHGLFSSAEVEVREPPVDEVTSARSIARRSARHRIERHARAR